MACPPPGGSLAPDAHLAALAIEHGLALASTDGDFARFPGLRGQNPRAASRGSGRLGAAQGVMGPWGCPERNCCTTGSSCARRASGLPLARMRPW